MQGDLIIVSEYCINSHIEPDFIRQLNEDGLIDIEWIDDRSYFPASQLNEVERYAHLYYDLAINIEGIDAIRHLLKRIEELQAEIRHLKNELRFYQ